MKWIHISDIHFNPAEDGRSSKQLRKKLPQFIQELDICADEMFVTGDFRNAAKQQDNELEVASQSVSYIMDIAKSAGIHDSAHIHIVPGNHDIKRLFASDDLTEIREHYDYDNGNLDKKTLKKLLKQFDFFKSVNKCLYSSNSVWTDNLLPLHTYRCFDGYNLLYLNTAITCGNKSDRGNLVIGNSDLYDALEKIQIENKDAPIIVLAHHSIDNFMKLEREAVETIFRDYPVKLYLCGDSHEIWFRGIDKFTEITMGCIKHEAGVQAVFSVGTLLGDKFSIKSYQWDNKFTSWGEYIQFNRQLENQLSNAHKIPEAIVLTNDWFQKQNNIQIKNLGQRYMPDLNVPISLEEVFDGLGRNTNFKKRFLLNADALLVSLNELRIDKISQFITDLKTNIENLPFESINNFNVSELRIQLNNFSSKLLKEKEKFEEKNDRNEIHKLNDALNHIFDFEEYLCSTEIELTNKPYLLIEGEGGIGKSHLMAEIINTRNISHEKSILLLGQHFTTKEKPFIQIMKMIGLEYSIDDFLLQLNNIGQKYTSRVLLFIDAMNEGEGRTIWKDYLPGIIEQLKSYPWIGLVMTIRSQYKEILLDNNENLIANIVMTKHTGFATVEYEAIKKYFDYYKIVYSKVPFSNQEFRNPLFLRVFCEGHKNETIDLDKIDLTNAYQKYILKINKRISEKCKYSNLLNIVQQVIIKMVEIKYKSLSGSNFIPLENTIDAIIEIEKKYNISSSILDELLSEGVLTKNIDYKGREYLYVTYEKLEDYMYAELIIQDLKIIGIDDFSVKYNFLLNREDILECLAIIIPEHTEYELFDVFYNNNENPAVRSSFIKSLKWRSPRTIIQKTFDYINNVICNYQFSFSELIEVLILISTKKEHPLNADNTSEYMLKYPMPDRDAIFIKEFDNMYRSEGSAIHRLLDWCISDNCYNADKETIRLAGTMIPLFLISPNRKLRNISTRALVNLFSGNINLLIEILANYQNVDDPYIIERLYAISFGCAVSESCKSETLKLAIFVYNSVFNKDHVYPNILLRDYAKNIMDYTIYILGGIDVDLDKITPPYKSVFPSIPSDTEIKRYELDYHKDNFKDYFWSQNNILSSMQVEYSRNGSPGGYGDFGRYVFQRYFSDWKQLDSNDLKNIAIKKIFNMGYDVEKHGRYDRNIVRGRHDVYKRERIGKKYQWIALYELAAQVSDNYMLETDTVDYGSKFCMGSFEPDIRDIDPTIFTIPDKIEDINRPLHESLYEISKNTAYQQWLTDFKDAPSMEKIIHIDFDNRVFILLNGWYSWTEEKQLGSKMFQNPQKSIWFLINSYIVEKNKINEFVEVLQKKNFMGRWMPEPHDNITLFNKEYYWSEGYRYYQNPYYGGNEWVNIEFRNSSPSLKLDKVLVPTFKYYTERDGDTFGENNNYSWYKPCYELFNGLGMNYGKENAVLYNTDGKIICFDSNEILKEDIGFFIDKTELLRYLDGKGYTIFWTILGEKQIISENRDDRYGMPNMSGVYYLDEKGRLTGNTMQFG